jgi:death on curing protein
MPVNYINIQQAIDTHLLTVQISGGGDTGVINSGQLESVLSHIRNDDYYPEFADKLTHLIWGACKFHCFADGNKRIAISLGAQFLLINGYLVLAAKFIQYMENISYHVAAGNIDKELLHRVVSALLEGTEEDESLKLEIYNAIKDDER